MYLQMKEKRGRPEGFAVPFMRGGLLLFLACLIVLLPRPLPPGASAQQAPVADADDAYISRREVDRSYRRLDFRHLWFFSAGVHRFQDNHLPSGRPAVVLQDTRFVDTLVQQGLPRDHIVALRDSECTTANCRNGLAELACRAEPGDFLLVFIHSHGSGKAGGHIATYETGGLWSFEEIVAQIEQSFPGNHACLCVAACDSGSLLNTVKQAPRRVAYFCVTSAQANVAALTVATADFEACLRDCFGAAPCPDVNHDGVITFEELGYYITKDRRFLFHSRPDFGWTDFFDPNIIVNDARSKKGGRDCCLVKLRSGVKGRVVEDAGGRVLVRGSKNPSLLEWARNGAIVKIRNGD